jgi:hypothetical protein
VHPFDQHDLDLTRRRFFGVGARSIGAGLGALGPRRGARSPASRRVGVAVPGRGLPRSPGGARGPHFTPKAKRVVYLHMEGAPSQIDLYDHKPLLAERFDQDLPESIRGGQRLTGMTSGQTRFPTAPSMFKFERAENRADGVFLSELIPQTAKIAGELCFVHSMRTEAINHEPAITFFQTGNQQPGRPSFGAWASYGLGSENQDLPSFVVLITQGFGNMQALSARFWGSGFLPSRAPGLQAALERRSRALPGRPAGCLARGPPQAARPAGRAERARGRAIDRPRGARAHRAGRDGLPHADVRCPSSWTSRTSRPRRSSCTARRRASRARSRRAACSRAACSSAACASCSSTSAAGTTTATCRPSCACRRPHPTARRPRSSPDPEAPRAARTTRSCCARASSARTVYCQGDLKRDNYGRDHHPRCFSLWLAGGGIAPGITYGKTDDWSYNVVENPVDVHDLHATMLHLLASTTNA